MCEGQSGTGAVVARNSPDPVRAAPSSPTTAIACIGNDYIQLSQMSASRSLADPC